MFSEQEKIMDPTFQSKRSGRIMVLEKYPCGSLHSGGGCSVYYLSRCDCGKEFIARGDELSKHPYSCGCTAKRKYVQGHNSIEYKDGTILSMPKPTKAVYSNYTSRVSGVYLDSNRKKWRGQFIFKQKKYNLEIFKTKEEAIKARIEGEKKYYDSMLKNSKSGI